jgi:hypothetical protein
MLPALSLDNGGIQCTSEYRQHLVSEVPAQRQGIREVSRVSQKISNLFAYKVNGKAHNQSPTNLVQPEVEVFLSGIPFEKDGEVKGVQHDGRKEI